MYGRITRLEGSAEQMQEGTEFVRQTVLPGVRELDGFRGMLNLVDREAGKGLSITLWETEEAMRASDAAANRLRDEGAEKLGATITGVERYEVTISEIPSIVSV